MHRVLAANAVLVHFMNEALTPIKFTSKFLESNRSKVLLVENKTFVQFDLFLVQYRLAFDITHIQ